ncbi:CopG family transcriptional regulator [Nocardia sp. NPDC051570]|uniref:CopG family transcriptional regulator n=1 Tax=Nocardia sp. NPDC051570 TaxID=3364324 RepID=UPI003798C711
MSKRRTNVYADAADLDLIKEAARRRGVPEAEIIREGIHLAALANRVWDEPLDWPTFAGGGAVADSQTVSDAVSGGASDE